MKTVKLVLDVGQEASSFEAIHAVRIKDVKNGKVTLEVFIDNHSEDILDKLELAAYTEDFPEKLELECL